MNKKIIWGVIVVILVVAGLFVYRDLSRSYCAPYCPNMTDQDREEIKRQASEATNASEKIATPENTSNGGTFIVKKAEWGISFPLPLGWNVTNDIDSQVILTQHSSGDRITLDYTESQSYTDIDAKRGQVTYTFNDVSGKWIAVENTYTDGGMVSNEAKPILMIENIIPVFAGSSRWKTYIIPLSNTQFLKINITGSGQTLPLDAFIKTITITG